MFEVRIDTTLAEPEALRGTNPRQWPNLTRAMRASLQVVQTEWMAAVYGNQIAGMSYRLRNQEYKAAITSPKAIEYPDGSVFTGAVVSTYRYTMDIERGYGPFDMKPGLLKGSTVRRNKDGKKYTVVPFRHSTPDSKGSTGGFASQMPRSVYNQAKGGKRITNQDLVNIDANNPGSTLSEPDTNDAGYTHQAPIYESMKKYGAPNHGQYMTFRTVSETSAPLSWTYPRKPPNQVMNAVAQKVKPQIERMLNEAFGRDAIRALGA